MKIPPFQPLLMNIKLNNILTLDSTKKFAKESLTVSGWGYENPNPPYKLATALQATKLIGLTQEECQSKYLLIDLIVNENVHICAARENSGICQGDSGGKSII